MSDLVLYGIPMAGMSLLCLLVIVWGKVHP